MRNRGARRLVIAQAKKVMGEKGIIGLDHGKTWDALLQMNLLQGMTEEQAMDLQLRECGTLEVFIEIQTRRAQERMAHGI